MSLSLNKDLTQLIITANKLKDGVVVYFNGTDWCENIHQAMLCTDGDFLMKEAFKTIELENLISVELIKVEMRNSIITPVSMREKIRAQGPTIKYSENNQIKIRDENVSV